MKYLLTLITLASSFFAQGQIEVKESPKKFTVGLIKKTQTELYGQVIDADTVYVLVFNNAEYKIINDFQAISFRNEDNTLDKFYKILKSVFLEENKKNKEYTVQFNLGTHAVSVNTFRSGGGTSAMFFTKKGHCFLSDNDIDKLFGK